MRAYFALVFTIFRSRFYDDYIVFAATKSIEAPRGRPELRRRRPTLGFVSKRKIGTINRLTGSLRN